jgi:hypothetical protein
VSADNVVPADEFDRLRRAKRTGLADFRDEEGAPVEALDFARRRTKLPDLKRVVKHGERNALYDLELDGGERIGIGRSSDLLNPREVDAALADAGVAIPYYAPKPWREVAAALIAIAEVEDTGSTEAEETAGWLISFLRQHPRETVNVTDRSKVARVREDAESHPIFFGGDERLYIYGESFETFLRVSKRVAIGPADLSRRLGNLGFEKTRFEERTEESLPRPRFWRSARGFDPEEVV